MTLTYDTTFGGSFTAPANVVNSFAQNLTLVTDNTYKGNFDMTEGNVIQPSFGGMMSLSAA
jgi:hypothetical protein